LTEICRALKKNNKSAIKMSSADAAVYSSSGRPDWLKKDSNKAKQFEDFIRDNIFVPIVSSNCAPHINAIQLCEAAYREKQEGKLKHGQCFAQNNQFLACSKVAMNTTFNECNSLYEDVMKKSLPVFDQGKETPEYQLAYDKYARCVGYKSNKSGHFNLSGYQ
jgi:hypothetical protein